MSDVVIPIGDRGSGAGVARAGVVVKDAWDAGSISDFAGTNGEALASGATKPYVDQLDGKIILTDTGNLASASIALYIRIFNATGASEDNYLITASDANTVTFEDNGLSGGTFASDGNADYSIGGVGQVDDGSDLQNQWDDIGTYTAGNNVTVYCNQPAIASTIQLDFELTGTTTVIGYASTNSSFIEDGTTQVVTLTSAIAVNAVIEITGDNVTLRHIKVVGNGGSTLPSYGISATSAAAECGPYDCQATGYSTIGFLLSGSGAKPVQCKAFGGDTGISMVGSDSECAYCLVIGATSKAFNMQNNKGTVNCIAIGGLIGFLMLANPKNLLANSIAWDVVEGCKSGVNDRYGYTVVNCSFNCSTYAFSCFVSSGMRVYNNHVDAGTATFNPNLTVMSNIGTIETATPKFNKIVELTDLASTTGTSIVTSLTGGFTAAMVGKDLLVASGTNFVGGAYEITGHTDTNTITLAEDPTNGSNASAGIGGYYDFRLQTDSPLRDAGAGEFSNIGAYDDTDTPAIGDIVFPATTNNVDGTYISALEASYELGETYGEDGTEFTGEFEGGGGSSGGGYRSRYK